MKISFVLILFLLSCSPHTKRITVIDNANKFEIVFFNKEDSLVQTDTSKYFITAFKEVLKGGRKKETFCDSSGIIRFFSDDSLIYKTYFTTEITSGLEGCEFVWEGDEARRLTYTVGMYINETFYKLKY